MCVIHALDCGGNNDTIHTARVYILDCGGVGGVAAVLAKPPSLQIWVFGVSFQVLLLLLR